jgi:hypothetical protein
VQRRPEHPVTVGVFGQMVYVYSVHLASVVQAEAVWYDHLTRPSGLCHFKLDRSIACLGGYANHLPISEMEFVRVRLIHWPP